MNTTTKEVPEDIELLLPWHAAGTLSRKDAARVCKLNHVVLLGFSLTAMPTCKMQLTSPAAARYSP